MNIDPDVNKHDLSPVSSIGGNCKKGSGITKRNKNGYEEQEQ
jgi:hypothetical protein